MDILVADPEGKWYRSSARYGFTDPDSGTRFDPGVHTQAKETDWVKLQSAWLVETENPVAPQPEAAPAAAPAPKPKT